MAINKVSLFVPLGIFILLVIALALGFKLEDPHLLPSELISKPFPEFNLQSLTEESRELSKSDVEGEVSLVNVWATWCPNCLVEHPELTRIAEEEGVRLIGVNYNDDSAKARQWLKRHGNPFEFSLVDDNGKLAIDLGVYGAPETFVVDAQGVIHYRHVGVVSRRVWLDILAPLIKQLEAEA